MPNPWTRPLAAALLVALAAGPAPAQSGEEVMRRAVEAYEDRVEGIRAYTVTQHADVVGTAATHRFEKQARDGHPVFVPASGGEDVEGPRGWGNPYALFLAMADRAALRGRDTVDGREVWRLAVDDFSDVEAGPMTPAGARGEFRPETAVFRIDVESHVLRRLSMQGAMVTEQGENPIRMTARFEDYRDRAGMLYPFRTRISVDGMDAVMSPGDRERAERQLRLLRTRLDSLSEAEREKVEPRVRPQIEQLEMAVEEGRVEVTVVVHELVVNPDGSAGG